MKYLLLIYDNEKDLNAMPADARQKFHGEYMTFTQEIRGSGHHVVGEALQSVQTAATVRIRNGKLSRIDGPFAETREQLGGFYMIEAKDLDEAAKIPARIPSASSGA